jgi:LacI family transcriptional regulator, galactose operon repressor
MANRSTIRDVAGQAGVSITTVSRVLNGTGPVDAGTAEKVRCVVDALNYIPHAAARTLASRRMNTLGLLLLDIGGEFYTPLLRGIETVASQAGFDLLIHSTSTSLSGKLSRHTLGEHNTDGLLVFIDALNNAELIRLHATSFPVVMMHQSPPKGSNIPVVTIENQSGAQKIVDHLIEKHGCRRIVFAQGPLGNEDSELREKGYRQSLKKHDLPVDPALIIRGSFDPNLAYASIKEFLATRPDFDGIFTGDDDNAAGILQALREAGRQVPEEIAVAGFDDSIFARLLTPPLTTVRAPIMQVGEAAARQLIRLIHGEQVETRLVLPTELVIRQSCGCSA